MKTRLAVNGTPIQPHACAVLLFPALSISTTKLVNEDSATNGAAGSPEQGEIRSADQATQDWWRHLGAIWRTHLQGSSDVFLPVHLPDDGLCCDLCDCLVVYHV
uniref:Uncharacterized protein n=1 Tax=Oryza rufipogon TaxID=4529 RepID=A0A0E0N632_ORYRU